MYISTAAPTWLQQDRLDCSWLSHITKILAVEFWAILLRRGLWFMFHATLNCRRYKNTQRKIHSRKWSFHNGLTNSGPLQVICFLARPVSGVDSLSRHVIPIMLLNQTHWILLSYRSPPHRKASKSFEIGRDPRPTTEAL